MDKLGQGRIQGDLGGLRHSHLGWVGVGVLPMGSLQVGQSCGTETRGKVSMREQPIPAITSSETFPDLFPVPSTACWPLPTPTHPNQALQHHLEGVCSVVGHPVGRYKPPLRIYPARDTSHQHSTSKPSVTHRTSGLHGIACINPAPIFA